MNIVIKRILVLFIAIIVLPLIFCNDNKTKEILNGDFRIPIEIDQVVTVSSTEIKVTFKQELDNTAIQNLSHYTITNKANDTLLINKAVIKDNPKIIHITTDIQAPEEKYNILIKGAIGLNGLSTPLGGVKGEFIGYPMTYLTVETVTAINQTMIKVKFGQNIKFDTANTISQYLIQNNDSKILKITSVIRDNQSDRIIYIGTDIQVKDMAYSLTVYGVKGISNEVTPLSGLKTEFKGYNPAIEDRYFSIFVPGTITVDEEFEISISAFRGIDNSLILTYTDPIVWKVIGGGKLTITDSPGFIEGKQVVKATYNDALKEGETKAITIVATSSKDANFTGMSNILNAKAPVFINHFQIIAPDNAVIKEDFDITITAIGGDSSIFESYDGTVNFSYTGGNGDLNPISASGFVKGILTTSINFTGLTDELKITAVDSKDPKISGTSKAIYMGLSLGDNSPLKLTASSSETQANLTWNQVPKAVAYYIYRDDVEIHIAGPAEYDYKDTGLTTGVSYTYRVEAKSISEVITKSSVIATTCACKTVISAANTNNVIIPPTTWTKANSPYCVEDDVTVQSSLTIEPGIVLRFSDDTGITVETSAWLIVSGTSSEPILMTSRNANPVAGDWDGIKYNSDSQGTSFTAGNEYDWGSVVKHTTIEYGGPAIYAEVSLDVEHCLFRNNQSPRLNDSAGGVYIRKATGTAVVRNCNIDHNSIEATGTRYSGAGGVSLLDSTTVIFENNILNANTGIVTNVSGDAVCYVSGGTLIIGYTVDIKNNYFTNNSATGTGYSGHGANHTAGGINYWSYTKGTLENNYFYNNDGKLYRNGTSNSSKYSGGGALINSGNNTISNNTFIDNDIYSGTSASWNLGTYSSGGMTALGADHIIYKNTFINNVNSTYSGSTLTSNSYSSGALTIGSAGNHQITYNTFTDNSVNAHSVCAGGGVSAYSYVGGAIFTNGSSKINRNTFTNNSGIGSAANAANFAQSGGAVIIHGSDVEFKNNNLTGNIGSGTASGGAYASGGICVTNVSQNNTISHNTITGNKTDNTSISVASAILLAMADGNTVLNNHITGNLGKNTDFAVVFISHPNAVGYTCSHNNIFDNLYNFPSYDKKGNLWSADSNTHTASDNYWGGELSNKDDMYIVDSTTTIVGNGTVNTSAKASAWSLCKDFPSNSDCVGADF